ncbi:MAG: HepT-like ribonuclease domain-containing protein [Pseudonocardiaceae bacterium]
MVDLDRIHQRLELLAGYLIDDVLAGRLRGLAGLRNRLVHVYDEIDDARVHEALATGLPDLDAFATAVARLVS